MAAPLHGDADHEADPGPEERDGPVPIRPFDRSSLNDTLAEVLRATETRPAPAPFAPPRVPSPPAPAAPVPPPPSLPSSPAPPVPLSLRSAWPVPVGTPPEQATATGPTTGDAPPVGSGPSAEVAARIPSGLRLLPPAPPPPPAVAAPAPPVEAVAAIRSWRPEDDDILPARRGRGRWRR